MSHPAGTSTNRILRCLGIMVFAILASTAQAEISETKSPPPEVYLNPQGFTSSKECGKCHTDIFESWNQSLHAQSATNPVFWTAFLQAHFKDPKNAEQTCLACHAPIALFIKDTKLAQPISREGVNCDYCHTISSLNSEFPGPLFNHLLGRVKQGPREPGRSTAHKILKNPLYKQSVICASCHELVNDSGVKIIGTFSEWQESPYATRNIHCQNCHMSKIKGTLLNPDYFDNAEEEISDHDPGAGHALSMRRKSLKLEIKEVAIHNQKITVVTEITNTGAGHKIPTGLPTKKIILNVSVLAKDGKPIQSQQRVYQKVLIDGNGLAVEKDTDLILKDDLKLVSDNRIAPLETRRETFVFFLNKIGNQAISASVYYIHNPEVILPSPIAIKMVETTSTIKSAP